MLCGRGLAGQNSAVKRSWSTIIAIWALVLVAAIAVDASLGASAALVWYGTILASAIAGVALVHLVKARPEGIVRELAYVGGGSYLMLALFSGFGFLFGG